MGAEAGPAPAVPAAAAPHVPGVQWAQRKDRIFLTVGVGECRDVKLTLANDEARKTGRLRFAGTSGLDGKAYELELEFYGRLNEEESKVSVRGRSVFLVLAKLAKGPHWPRLLRAEGRAPKHIKVDFNMFMDESDEEAEENQKDFQLGDLDDFTKFDDPLDKDVHTDSEDSDDEDLPDLEKPF